ncbi:peptidase, M16 family protein [Algoriphagus aquatilis]|uniref:Peptidase, M16 family protein n=1 Tax=Algoriphagus aquatilis TaxID=490186 RepID=A0ABW0BZW6_9BACT
MKKLLLPLALLLVFTGVSNARVFEEIPAKKPDFASLNDPATVISNYIKAVGGLEKVQGIKNASLTGEANFQGQIIEIKTVADAENARLMQSTSLGGNVVQKTLFSGGKGQMMAMGQVQELPDEMASMLKVQTYVFPEVHYEALGFKLAFIGTEDMDGEQVHKLEITAPNGMVTNEFYSVNSGLKLKTSSAATGDIMYSDYQEVDGVKFPMMLTIKNPMLPVALETKMKSVSFNQQLSDADFQ